MNLQGGSDQGVANEGNTMCGPPRGMEAGMAGGAILTSARHPPTHQTLTQTV